MNTHDVLAEVVSKVRCKPGWRFKFSLEGPPALQIWVHGPNSRASGDITIVHSFPIPEATYNRKTWRRWVFECCIKVETHEIGEWFLDAGERPFAPLHGPGEDPYTIHEFRPVADGTMNQDGSQSHMGP